MFWTDFQLNEDEQMYRDSIYRFELEDRGIDFIEDYSLLIKEADEFFFDDLGFRKIHPIKNIKNIVAKLMQQGLYTPYLDKRGLFTINSIEFYSLLESVLNQYKETCILEVGAGDGSLTFYFNDQKGFRIKAVDDLSYGRGNLDLNSPLAYRPQMQVVEKANIDCALARYQPVTIISSWLVNPKYNLKDDSKILDYPSVSNYLWIGDDSKRFSSSPEFWDRKDFHYELIDIKGTQFTQLDDENNMRASMCLITRI